MSLSPQALEAVEVIRRDLSIVTEVDYEGVNFYESPRLVVRVRLFIGDDEISASKSFAYLPSPKEEA